MTFLLKLVDLIPTWLLFVALAVLGTLFGVEVMRVNHAHVQTAQAVAKAAQTEAEFADYKAAAAETARLLQASNDKRALDQLTKVKEAQDAAKVREASLRADADGARKQLDRLRVALRKAIASGSNPVPGAAPDANAEPAATVGQLFLECAAAYGELAAKAGGHASDVQTLTASWPK